MTGDILDRGIAEVRAAYRGGALTPVDVLEAVLARIEERNPLINAIAHLAAEPARRAAEASARRWRRGRPISALDGVPVTVKDSIDVAGMPWRHGSAAHTGVPDAVTDAPPAARLREAGAVIVAKTTMPDFGMLASGVSSLYGVVRNPWRPDRSPGGSSAGAGAALAAGIGYAAVGTDIAGSVRLPAAHCGLVALKPTQGRIPHLPASTMRSAGPMARSADEVIDLYRILTRPDARDAWSLAPEADELDRGFGPRGLRVAVLTELVAGSAPDPRIAETVRTAAGLLGDAGAVVEELPAPWETDPFPALDRVFQVRARSEWQSLPPQQRALVLPAVADWAAPAGDYRAVDHAADLVAVDATRSRLLAALSGYDLVLTPVLPTVGFAAEAVGLDAAHPLAHCGYTAWFNQTGQPASTLCFGFADGCPVGVQLAGPRFADQLVLRATRWLEAHRPFPMPRPELGAAVPAGGL